MDPWLLANSNSNGMSVDFDVSICSRNKFDPGTMEYSPLFGAATMILLAPRASVAVLVLLLSDILFGFEYWGNHSGISGVDKFAQGIIAVLWWPW